MNTSSWRARLTGILATLAMTAGLLTATAAPASAAPIACAFDGASNTCLAIQNAGSSRWDVSVSFFGFMSQSYADEIIACPGSGFFSAVLFGDDGGHPADDNLGSIPLVFGYPRSDPSGIIAEFFRAGTNLNEDSGADEVYVEVTYLDCHTGLWVLHRTPTIRGTF